MNTKHIKNHERYVVHGQIRMMRLQQNDVELHSHDFFELVYVFEGSAVHRVGTEEIFLQAGDYFIIDPGSEHCYRDVDGFEIVNCLFLPEYIDRALADCPSLSFLLSNQVLRFGVPVDVHIADRRFHDTDGTVGRLIRQMEREFADQRVGHMELLRCFLTQVLVCALRSAEEAERAQVRHSLTADVVAYLQAHFAQPFSLEQLSRRFGYTPPYVSSLFRKDMGMTLQAFVQKLRVEEACRLIAQEKLGLCAIAQAVGYSDEKHFSKVFRRYKGVSPRLYKASGQGEIKNPG